MRKRLSFLMAMIVMVQMIMPMCVQASEFSPSPQTKYAKSFIEDCDGQRWFINEMERILNANAKSLNYIESSADLDIIKSIGLKNGGIVGKIPAAIGELKKLQYLFLSGNQLSGLLPIELYALPMLQNIDLSKNLYTGTIPKEFGAMPVLTHLNLSGNQYTGNIPAEILANTNLQYIDLSGNRLSGGIPVEINGMTGLTYLNLSENKWGGAIPNMDMLLELKSLSLWDCGLTGNIHESVYGLVNLQILDLANNGLTGEIHADISKLAALQLLKLDNNRLSGRIPVEISALVNLQNLNVSNNKLRGTIPNVFAATLKEVHLENNFLRGTIPATLKASYDAGATVFVQNNYFTGSNAKDIINSEKNFADGASNEQYQLSTSRSTTQIFKERTTNLYPLLRNTSKASGNTTTKVCLQPDEYLLTYDSSKLEVSVDASGINVRAFGEIPQVEQQKITFEIKDNNNSEYSKTTMIVTTEAISTGGGVGLTPQIPSKEKHSPYISGYPDGRFGIADSVTRGQVAKMIIGALEIEIDSPKTSTYLDVQNDIWSLAYIESATERGYMNGYVDGTFAPESAMTRAELATCIARVADKLGYTAPQDEKLFVDVSEDKWYAKSVQKAAELGLIAGYEDGTFRPEATVRRDEAVAMINRMLQRDPQTAIELQAATNPFSDIEKSQWSYMHIMESAVAHQH